MAFDRWPAHLVLAATLLAALSLAACGRKGGLDLPPDAAAAEPASAAATPAPVPGAAFIPGMSQPPTGQNGFDQRGNPVAPQGVKRSFILDPILY